jgi:hypothetical protein
MALNGSFDTDFEVNEILSDFHDDLCHTSAGFSLGIALSISIPFFGPLIAVGYAVKGALALSRIVNQRAVNREKLTSAEVGSTLFQARLTHVQYGTYDGEVAALLLFNFQFGFRNKSVKRIIFADIELGFEETDGPDLQSPKPQNPLNDPVVALLSPAWVYGKVSTVQHKKKRKISVPVHFQQFGIDVGPNFESLNKENI